MAWDGAGGAGRGYGARMPQYKVLSQQDRALTGKFSPQRLEEAINAYAVQGWRVVSMTTAEFPGLGRNRDEIVVLLEHP